MRAPGPARPRGRRDRERKPLAAVRPSRADGQARLSFELYLARHGETEWSLSGRHTGNTDLPLTARGEDKARELGRRLRDVHFDAVYSSPLRRALRTCELAGMGRPTITPLLREVDYGAYEGLTTDEIEQTRPGWELYRDGSPRGETPAQMYARAEEFIATATSGRDGGRVIAFAHGHILRAVGVAWIGARIELAARLLLDVATVSVLRDGDHGRVVALWNAG